MNEQGLLFCVPTETKSRDESRVLARRTDPVTSYEAARKMVDFGRLGTQRRAVLDALRQCNGVTSAELAETMGVSRYLTARRLPDLAKGGRVARGPTRVCRVAGTRAVTWWVTEGASHE